MNTRPSLVSGLNPFFRPTVRIRPSRERPVGAAASQERCASAMLIHELYGATKPKCAPEPEAIGRTAVLAEAKEKKSYPFPVWSGLLSQNHRERMGIAIWLFLWFVDRITSDAGGWGLVLGGKPVKDTEIAECLGLHKNSVHRDRKTLLAGSYIEASRTPYGFRYRVRKSRKFNIWGKKRVTTNGDSLEPESPNVVTPESPLVVETKKTMQLDHAARRRSSPEQRIALKKIDSESETAECFLAWRFIGAEDPFGHTRFRNRWISTFESRKAGESVERVMERCAVHCQEHGIGVPARFYELKRLAERAGPVSATPIVRSRNLGVERE